MEEKLFLVRVAEQSERYDDMIMYLEQVVDGKDGADFNQDERNLLSVGFKSYISDARSAIRIINAIEVNPKYKKFG